MNIIIADGSAERAFLEGLKSRSQEADKQVVEAVSQIIENVRVRGDEAVREYTLKFDGKLPPAVEVSREEINDALTGADEEFVNALLDAQENIADFHNRQKHQSFLNPQPNGVILGQRIRGLDRVGLYVPGGTAAYPQQCADERHPRQDCRGQRADYGDAAHEGRPGQSGHPGGRRHLRRGPGVPVRRRSGGGGPGLRHRDHPQGG